MLYDVKLTPMFMINFDMNQLEDINIVYSKKVKLYFYIT